MATDSSFLCVTIDCERDKGAGWRVQRPAAYAGVHDGIVKKLHPLFASFGVTPTYLLSPEVIRDDASLDAITKLPGAFELGTHLHAEYVAPDADDDAESSTFQAALPADVERAKLEALTRLFRERVGRAPRSFRAGRFGIGATTLAILADLGYAVDSSVTPFLDWSATGPGAPDFRDAPVSPYRPDPTQPARVGDSPVWEVPVTIRRGPWQLLPGVGRSLPHRWLRPTWGSARGLVALARRVLAEGRETRRPPRPTVLNVMFHNVEVTPGASPYAADEADASAILGRLAALLAFARDAGVRSVGLADVPGLVS
ncbi:MAG TPA: hypothetical protein VHJ20_15635 [Polyangia bacterium]|nr:hypothetical protein [Polyangia bacterium]